MKCSLVQPRKLWHYTAWNVSIFGVFLVRIFPRSDRMRRDTPYLCVFSPDAGKYGPEKLQTRTTFTHCYLITFFFSHFTRHPFQLSVFYLILKSAIWFAQRIKSLVSIWNSILDWKWLNDCAFLFFVLFCFSCVEKFWNLVSDWPTELCL